MWTIKVKSKSYKYKHLKSVVFSIYNTYNEFIDKAIWENLHNNHKINNTGINSFKVVKDHYKKKSLAIKKLKLLGELERLSMPTD